MSKYKTNEDYFSFAKTLSVIPTEDLLVLLKNHKIRIPSYVHRFILRETIQRRVFQPKLYQSYTDEVKYRLRGYKDYSLFLLEKLIEDYNLDFDAETYKELFFDLLFLNRDIYNLKNAFVDDLEKLKYKYAVDFEKISYHDFISQFKEIIYEPSGFLDGVSLRILKDVLIHSCTLGDLRGLGEKYGVKVPRRINKGRLIDILAARFRLTPEEAELLNDKSVLELEIYAKEKGFHISIDLKKSDMVEYIIYDLKMYHQEASKDSHNYSVPLPTAADTVQIDVIEFQTNDQDIPVVEVEEETPLPEVVMEEETELVESVIEPETPMEAEVVETPVEAKPVITPEPEPEPQPTPEPVTVLPQPTPEPQKEEPAPKPAEPVKPVEPDFSREERELLDEKINLIIKKYHKQRRRKRFWTVFWICFTVLVLGFAGYCYLYYTYISPGTLPFGIPIFW